MCDSRLERSLRKEEDVEVIEAPGMMVSFWIVAKRPRCEVELMRFPRADLSSWEAIVRYVSYQAKVWRRIGTYRQFQTA
jgi:hypothetical protein